MIVSLSRLILSGELIIGEAAKFRDYRESKMNALLMKLAAQVDLSGKLVRVVLEGLEERFNLRQNRVDFILQRVALSRDEGPNSRNPKELLFDAVSRIEILQGTLRRGFKGIGVEVLETKSVKEVGHFMHQKTNHISPNKRFGNLRIRLKLFQSLRTPVQIFKKGERAHNSTKLVGLSNRN